MHARFVNDVFTPAPRRIRLGSEQVFNPTDEMLEALGYKPVVFTECPEAPDGFYAECGWSETPAAIEQTWTLCALPGSGEGVD